MLSFLGYNFSVYSDLSKKINKQINKFGHCPGNEIKVLLELLTLYSKKFLFLFIQTLLNYCKY